MENWQGVIVGAMGVLAAVFIIGGIIKIDKSYKRFWPLNIIGGFVWGDAIVFGTFWLIASILSFCLQNWFLFELIFLCFWLIRSAGETLYWFLQQFSIAKREPPENIWFYRYIKSDAVWFTFQIWWQCICVTSLVLIILLLRG